MDELVPQPPRRSRRIRLSVRVVMGLVLLAGGVLGWFAYTARVEREAVEAILGVGGSITYRSGFSEGSYSMPVIGLGPLFPGDTLTIHRISMSARSWLAKQVGPEFVDSVSRVEVRGAKVDDAFLGKVARLPNLEWLELASWGGWPDRSKPDEPTVTAAGLALLRHATRLRSLKLDSVRVTQAALPVLREIPQLRELELPGVNDAGLAHLAGLTSLTSLKTGGSGITDSGLAHLKGCTALESLGLPHTNITPSGTATSPGYAPIYRGSSWMAHPSMTSPPCVA